MCRTREPLKVFMIDSVGEHRGMHYYNFALVSALNKVGVETLLISTEETETHPLRPTNVTIKAGFKRIYGDSIKLLRGAYYGISLLRIAFWAWREHPDIVHFHFHQVPTLDWVLLYWLKVTGVHSIITVHDVLPFNMGNDYASARGSIYHRLYSISSGLILNSEYAQEALSQLDHSLLNKSELIAHGGYTDISMNACNQSTDQTAKKEAAKLEIGLQSETPIILIFGTIKPNKRLDIAIRALALISHTHPKAKMIIAGALQDRDIDKDIALATELGMADSVNWLLGYATDEELNRLITAADIVVFPYQWIYQSGALMMAMSMAKPIVATAVGSNIDILQNEETGLLVSVESPDEMAEAILTLLNNPKKATSIGKAAHAFVEDQFSWDKIAQKTAQFYRQLLE